MIVPHKIMIIDDESRNRDLLECLLGEHFDIQKVDSGDKALEVVLTYMPDVILLDIMMPGLDGYETCRKIKENPKLKFIKIILVSGWNSIEDRLKGYECGADDYIAKPFDADELLAKINVYLKLKSMEEVDSIKGDFLSLISHETNTPLNGIIGLSELLLGRDDLSSEHLELIKMIHESGYRLHDFLNRAKLLCELKTGATIVKSFDLYLGVVKSSVEKVNKKYMKGVEINIDIDPELKLMADWGMISNAVTMLVDNAVKFSNDNGRVDIYTVVDDGRCDLYVVDYGLGISENSIRTIFDEFSVEDVSHHSSGFGLSLATIKEIASLHGGDIEVSSTPGVKTTFVLSLPYQNIE